MTTQTEYTKYIYSTQPKLLPVQRADGWPDDSLLRSLGFDPEDEELWIGELTADWKGHKKGATVISGLMLEGYPLAIEKDK